MPDYRWCPPVPVYHNILVAEHQRWDGLYTREEKGLTLMFHIVEHLSTMRFVLLYQRKDSSVKKNNFAGIHLLHPHLRIPATGGRIKKFGSLGYRLKIHSKNFRVINIDSPGDTRNLNKYTVHLICLW